MDADDIFKASRQLNRLSEDLSTLSMSIPDMNAIALDGAISFTIKPEANVGSALLAAMRLARLLNLPVSTTVGKESLVVNPAPVEKEQVTLTALTDQFHTALVRSKERT